MGHEPAKSHDRPQPAHPLRQAVELDETTLLPTLQAEGETMPNVEQLEIILNPDVGATSLPKGEFKLALHRLNKFSNRWRASGGIQWESFPPGIADDKTMREMAILQKAANPGNSGLTDKDDPALLQLANVIEKHVRACPEQWLIMHRAFCEDAARAQEGSA